MSYIFSPQRLLKVAIAWGFITKEQSNIVHFRKSAEEVAEETTNNWPEGQGFGSSDMTFAVQNFLDISGFKTDFVNGTLVVLDDTKDLPKNLAKRKKNAERILGYPLGESRCLAALYRNEVQGEGGRTVGYMLDNGFLDLHNGQHTQIGDTAIELGHYYTSLKK